MFITLDIHLTQLNALYQHYKDHITRVSAPHGHVLHHIECIQFDIWSIQYTFPIYKDFFLKASND